MSSPSMSVLLFMFALLIALFTVQAKPSHPFAFHSFPDHDDALPPLYPPAHFHAVAPAAPALLPAPAPLPLAAPAPVFEPAPAPFFHAHAYAPLPAPVFHAPAPLPAPVFHAAAPVIAPAPVLPIAKVLPPVFEAAPFALSAPTYRAIPGPKTTTHHISVGYAFPAPATAKLLAPSLHSHFAAPTPLSLGHHHHHFDHHHHSLF